MRKKLNYNRKVLWQIYIYIYNVLRVKIRYDSCCLGNFGSFFRGYDYELGFKEYGGSYQMKESGKIK